MAQWLNPETGQWEEKEDETSFNSGTTAFGMGGMPAPLAGPSMAPAWGEAGFFKAPQLPEGYQVGEEGYTRSYKDPYATTYDLMNSSGKSIGTGYDSLQDALAKMVYTSGRSGNTQDGWSHSYYNTQGEGFIPGINPVYTPGKTFGSEADLYAALLADPGKPLSLESREKYSRPIIDQQLQEALGQYLTGVGPASVEDWTYHRDFTGNGIADNITGLNSLYGSNVLIGPDGNILGRQLGLDPGSYLSNDTTGDVKSNSNVYRDYNAGAENFLQSMGNGYGFINEADISKFPGWKNVDEANYSNESFKFNDFMAKAVPMAIMAMAAPEIGAGLGGLFEGAAVPGAISATEGGLNIGALLGESAGMGFTPAAGLGFTPASSIGSLAEFGLGFGDIGAGFSGGIADSINSGLGSLFDTQGFSGADFLGGGGSLGEFTTPQAFMPTPEMISPTLPDFTGPPILSDSPGQFIDDWGGGTNELGEFTNRRGKLSMPDRVSTALRQLGLSRDTVASLTKGGGNMYDFLTNPVGGRQAGMFKAPSPLEMLYKGGKGLLDYKSNQDAMDMYKEQMDRATNWTDPNRARGDVANAMWAQNFQNPRASFADFMAGGGRAFTDQARAQAAKGGRRGSYLNSGKMNSDLMSLFLQNQNQRGNSLAQGFAPGVNNEAAAMQYMPQLAQMERNKYQPIGQAIDSIMRQFQLSDLFGA